MAQQILYEMAFASIFAAFLRVACMLQPEGVHTRARTHAHAHTHTHHTHTQHTPLALLIELHECVHVI